MMIYVTDTSLKKCASVHSDEMLLQQRQNIYRIYAALETRRWTHKTQSRWLNHPTAWMWQSYGFALSHLGRHFDHEVVVRFGPKSKVLFRPTHGWGQPTPPWWWSLDRIVINNHRNLLRKRNAAWYGDKFPYATDINTVPHVVDPVWPVTKEGNRTFGLTSKGAPRHEPSIFESSLY